MTTQRSKSRPTQSQRRSARRERRNRRKRLVRFGAFSAVGVVAVIFIAALFLPGLNLSFGGSGSAPTGPGARMSDQGNLHVEPDQSHPEYNSTPATSGWHYEQPLAFRRVLFRSRWRTRCFFTTWSTVASAFTTTVPKVAMSWLTSYPPSSVGPARSSCRLTPTWIQR